MFIQLEQIDVRRFYTEPSTNTRIEGPALHISNVTINTDHIVSMIEHKNIYGEFDHTEILVITGKVYKVTERVLDIKEEMRRHNLEWQNETINLEY